MHGDIHILARFLTERRTWFNSRRVAEMARIWDSAALGQGSLLMQALVLVRQDRKKRPDNWLHEKLTHRQHRAYVLFAAKNGAGDPAATSELNQNMYLALCRETHARPRLDSIGFLHEPAQGTIQVHLPARNREAARRAVTSGTELSVAETIAALRWQRTGTT
jgi:hypothetical protein